MKPCPIPLLALALATLSATGALAQSSGLTPPSRRIDGGPSAPTGSPALPGKLPPAASPGARTDRRDADLVPAEALFAQAMTLVFEDRPADAVDPWRRGMEAAQRQSDASYLAQGYSVRSFIDDGLGDYAAAEAAARRGLALDANPAADAALEGNLGTALYEQGRFEEALEALDRSLVLHEANGQVAEQADRLMTMAIIRGEQRLLPQGEALYRRALVLSDAPGLEDVRMVVASNLAWNLHEQGHYAEAEPMLRQAVLDMKAVSGPVSRNAAAAITNLAGDLQAQGRHAEALPLFREALSLFEQTVGRQHSQVGWTLNAMARSTAVVDGPEAAEPFLREAVAVSAARLPPWHSEATGMVVDLARHLISRRRQGEALALLRGTGEALRGRLAGQSGSTQAAREFDRRRGVFRLQVEAAWSAAST